LGVVVGAGCGKERKRAKAGGHRPVHLLAAITHGSGPGDRPRPGRQAGKANETSHFQPPVPTRTFKKNGAWVMRNCEAVLYLTNLVITLFRIQAVTKYAAETRGNAQNPSQALRLLAISPG